MPGGSLHLQGGFFHAAAGCFPPVLARQLITFSIPNTMVLVSGKTVKALLRTGQPGLLALTGLETNFTATSAQEFLYKGVQPPEGHDRQRCHWRRWLYPAEEAWMQPALLLLGWIRPRIHNA